MQQFSGFCQNMDSFFCDTITEERRVVILLYFAIYKNEQTAVNTCNGHEVRLQENSKGKKILCGNTFSIQHTDLNRFFIKTGNILYKYPLANFDSVYYFDVRAFENSVILEVFHASYDDMGLSYKSVYTASAEKGTAGIKEDGEENLAYWHELFANGILLTNVIDSSEKNVNLYCRNENPMKEIRKVFQTAMQEHPFVFFKKMAASKKAYCQEYSPSAFPASQTKKISPYVGKGLDNDKNDTKWRHYAWSHEVMINGEWFLDVDVIHGPVKNGKMDIQKKQKFFLTENYVFSPSGDDAGILSSIELHGRLHAHKFADAHPRLLLERYHGKYPFLYLFSRESVPAFEILAKAGLGDMADAFIEEYMQLDLWIEQECRLRQARGADKQHPLRLLDVKEYSCAGTIWYPRIRNCIIYPYGKNDREIFGFRLAWLANIRFTDKCLGFYGIIKEMKEIIQHQPKAFCIPVDENLFHYMSVFFMDKNFTKTVSYLRGMGKDFTSMYMDYIRMCRQTGIYPDGIFPKNLKQSHDVMISYMNQKQEAEKKELAEKFSKTVSEDFYQNLVFQPENEKFCILAPRHAEDVVKESYRLSHCVRSYIPSVASGTTRIYFMRRKNKMAAPFLTIEVNMHDSITQCRGKGNRKPNAEEEQFLYLWADEKNLYANWN